MQGKWAESAVVLGKSTAFSEDFMGSVLIEFFQLLL
jgi:hypothetical protein